MKTASRYIPALRFDWLTRFYDPLIRTALREKRFKQLLVDQAGPQPGHRILDLGCGTATLTLMLKRACPAATVVGLDGDPKVLEMARGKARRAGIDIELRAGMAFDPPFENASFDRVLSSLMLHHLTTTDKERTLRRAFELLRPGGEIHIADWGKPQNGFMRAQYLMVQLIDGFETTRDNLRGRLPELLRGARFADVAETHREMTIFGTLSLFRGRKPR